MATMTEGEKQEHIEGFKADQLKRGAAMLVKMAKYVALADGHCKTGDSDCWLYFHDQAKLLDVVKVLRADGYRQLDAFKSPDDCPEQLSYTLIVKLRDGNWSDNGKSLGKILTDMKVNPVSVFNMFDGSFIVTLDDEVNLAAWTMFCAIHAKAMKSQGKSGKITPRRSIYTNPIELTKSFAVDFTGDN